MSKYLEVSVVAERLGVSPKTVYELIKERKIEAGNHGVKKGIRVVRVSLEEFEERRRNREE
jgi:excisionase family DNA binding protein